MVPFVSAFVVLFGFIGAMLAVSCCFTKFEVLAHLTLEGERLAPLFTEYMTPALRC